MQRLCRLFWSGRAPLLCRRVAPSRLCRRDCVAARHSATALLTLCAFVATSSGPAALPARPPVSQGDRGRAIPKASAPVAGAHRAATHEACCCRQPGQTRACGCRTSAATRARSCCAAPQGVANRVRPVSARQERAAANGVELHVSCTCENAPAGDFVASPQPKMATTAVARPPSVGQLFRPQLPKFLLPPLADAPATPPPRMRVG